MHNKQTINIFPKRIHFGERLFDIDDVTNYVDVSFDACFLLLIKIIC